MDLQNGNKLIKSRDNAPDSKTHVAKMEIKYSCQNIIESYINCYKSLAKFLLRIQFILSLLYKSPVA